MAPNLSASQHLIIQAMIEEGRLTNHEIASVARCSPRTITTCRTNPHLFGSTTAPNNGHGGRAPSMTQQMLENLLDLLRRKPWLRLEEMVIYLSDTYDELLSTSTVSRCLKKAGWSKKVARRIAREQSADLRDMYLHDLSSLEQNHVIYMWTKQAAITLRGFVAQAGLLWV